MPKVKHDRVPRRRVVPCAVASALTTARRLGCRPEGVVRLLRSSTAVWTVHLPGFPGSVAQDWRVGDKRPPVRSESPPGRAPGWIQSDRGLMLTYIPEEGQGS